MTKVVQGLEAMGLVERAPDVRDKRVIRLKATAQGRRILRKGRRLRVRTLAELMRTLTVEEIAVLSKAAHLLEKIVTK
jgi:DNA-binding MarR family transcriptional regulator